MGVGQPWSVSQTDSRVLSVEHSLGVHDSAAGVPHGGVERVLDRASIVQGTCQI